MLGLVVVLVLMMVNRFWGVLLLVRVFGRLLCVSVSWGEVNRWLLVLCMKWLLVVCIRVSFICWWFGCCRLMMMG